MAQEEKRPSSTQPKRLARAKIKRSETPLTEEERKAERKKKLRNIVVGAFAVILALGMMVPSLTYIVGGMRQSKANSEARELANALSEGEEVSSEQVDALYAEAASSYEATLESQPDDTEALQQLGNLYLTWGSAVNYYATDEGASDHAAELYAKAQGVYDRYLAIEDSSDVRVNRALCSLYSGQISDAQTQLEAIVADDPECSSAWANLGMVYDWFDPEAALAAYHISARREHRSRRPVQLHGVCPVAHRGAYGNRRGGCRGRGGCGRWRHRGRRRCGCQCRRPASRR